MRRSINGFNSRCLHAITKADYRETATNPVFDLVLAIRRRRMQYLGHILRMDTNRLVRRTLAAYVHGGEQVPPGSLLEDCELLLFEDRAILARDRKEGQKRVQTLH